LSTLPKVFITNKTKSIKYKPPASSTFSKCSDENQGIYFMWPKEGMCTYLNNNLTGMAQLGLKTKYPVCELTVCNVQFAHRFGQNGENCTSLFQTMCKKNLINVSCLQINAN
jgi:hypothetical protein